ARLVCRQPGLIIEAQAEMALPLADPAAAPGIEQDVPFVPHAVAPADLEPADDAEGFAPVAALRADLQRTEIVRHGRHLADFGHVTVGSHEHARTIGADCVDGGGRAKLDRRATGRAGDPHRRRNLAEAYRMRLKSSAFLAENSSCVRIPFSTRP